MAANGDTAVIPAQSVTAPPGGDRIFQALTGKKPLLEDLGLVKVILVYIENGRQQLMSNVLTQATLDKITNTMEDEAVS